MIGLPIRSIRHLHRVCDTSLNTVLIKFKESSYEICKAIKMPKDSPFGDTLFVFNNVTRSGSWSFDTVVTSKELKKWASLDEITSNYCRMLSIGTNDLSSLDKIIGEIVLLPNSFDKDYEKFLKENSKMVNSLIMNYGLNTRDIRIKRFYMYCDGSKNFFQWAINLYYKCGVSMTTIKNILTWNESYKQLSKNLSKGTITAYTSRESILPLLEELSTLRKDKRINDSINSFNTAQKRMLKDNELDDGIKQALWRFSRLSDTKKLNFIKKMSSVNDFAEFIRQLKFVTSVHFSWSKESFMDFINNVEGIKYEKIFENDKIVLIKAIDYETIKQLGKTTNWCISKNKSYWNNYIEHHHGNTTQYMIFDFSKLEDDKLSIVGFTTTRNKGITSAHNFINDDLMGGGRDEQVLLDSFLDKFKENHNIYGILNDDGIDITLVVEYDLPPYAWDKDSLMDYLYECVNPENVEVLKSSDGKMVLSVVDHNIRYFFGDGYMDNIDSENYENQHIIFIDFNKSKYDVNKIQFGIIDENGADEDYCMGVYNERSLNNGANFDSLLIEFGLPYNTIRRTNNPLVRLRNALASFNSPMMKEAIKECSRKEIKHVLKHEVGCDAYFDYLTRSVSTYMSFDYLDILYNNDLTINDVMSIEYMGDVIKEFASSMVNVSRATTCFRSMEGVTEKEIQDFYNRKLDNREDTKYIGYYLAIEKIVKNEKFSNSDYTKLLRRFFAFMGNCTKKIDVFEQIVDMVKDKLEYSNQSESIDFLVKYTVFYGSEALKSFIYTKAATNDSLNALVQRHKNAMEKINKKVVKCSTITSNSNIVAFSMDDITRIIEQPANNMEWHMDVHDLGDNPF